MVHRSTPHASVYRAYSGGGARSAIDSVDDSTLMQESTNSRGMKGETFFNHEAPQNYGFTSVVADARKSGNPGIIQQCAEGFVSFLGGNRSLPITAMMDDRRHRLLNLAKDAAKGATAMFGLKEWGQQFLNTEAGMFMTGNVEKLLKFQLVENQNGKQQQQQPGQKLARTFRSRSGVEFDIETFEIEPREGAGGGGTSNSDGSQGTSQPTGQKTLHKEESKTFLNMTKDRVETRRDNGYVHVEDKKITTHYKDDTQSTRCDDKHVHVRWKGSQVWVDAGGCWSSKPIKIKACSDAGGGTVPDQGPAAHSASAPLSIDSNANISMAANAPLKIAGATREVTEARHRAMQREEPMPFDNGYLFLDIDLTTLAVTPAGQLTVVGGAGGGISEAPSDGNHYARFNAAWSAVENMILDGGTF